tara:strand:+ start:728 stop:1543 length:816 start_codon:yes stop_codon:yes gene_type:complete
MSKGYIWICQNNETTDYTKLSQTLAKSLKKYNKHNNICVLTDKHTEEKLKKIKEIDIVRVFQDDDSADHKIKWANEYKVFTHSPFTHTIKLVADMVWTTNTDWWWYYLWQQDMVFAVDCYNYKNTVVKSKPYRPFHDRNFMPNIYSDLTYFRKSLTAINFGNICQAITKNWDTVKKQMLINCHDEYPSTDVVFALAYRIMDPTNKQLVDYPWFKFIHNKRFIHGLTNVREHKNYLMPLKTGEKIMLGSHAVTRPWHYVDKNTMEELDARIF